MMNKKLISLVILLVVIGVIVGVLIDKNHTSVKTVSKTQSVTVTKPSQTVKNTPIPSAFNKSQYSLSDPTSIWVVVNKQHPLNPLSYTPNDLVVPNIPLRVPGNESMQVRAVTASALEKMFADAKSQSINLMLSSGYRSYSYQVGLYNGYVKSEGQATADQQSARPGYSEHQTGLAADIEPLNRSCELEQCFGTTPEGEWLAANAYKYGFIIRYTPGNQSITGYEPEPWHIRYVGVALSTELHNTGVQTLEQFFGVTGGTIYKTN